MKHRRKIAQSVVAAYQGGHNKSAGMDLVHSDGSGERNVPDSFEFEPRAAEQLAKVLWSSTVAMGHLHTAYSLFSKLKSVGFSPDGHLGGRGYIMKVQDARNNLAASIEALSTLTDTLHDELAAEHWQALGQNDDVDTLVEESKRIQGDPEAAVEEDLDELDGDMDIGVSEGDDSEGEEGVEDGMFSDDEEGDEGDEDDADSEDDSFDFDDSEEDTEEDESGDEESLEESDDESDDGDDLFDFGDGDDEEEDPEESEEESEDEDDIFGFGDEDEDEDEEDDGKKKKKKKAASFLRTAAKAFEEDGSQLPTEVGEDEGVEPLDSDGDTSVELNPVDRTANVSALLRRIASGLRTSGAQVEVDTYHGDEGGPRMDDRGIGDGPYGSFNEGEDEHLPPKPRDEGWSPSTTTAPGAPLTKNNDPKW